ncbi:hypothetical protein [Streptomyces sp. TP-A0356]|uniref:hypothetical protein n=1 Tax=Streptomyces sp. TP-A0356 TaxID=1359208 RepID=UPI0006E198EE|nr:hypothetical protein [Streptomyces sp. TP-A0356]
MAEPKVIVSPPLPKGGRQVLVGDEVLGTAYSLHELTVYLQRAGLEGVDELDVAMSPLIEWHGGGPEVWPATE